MESADRQKTFAIYTLGCKVNQYDSEAIARQLRGLGLRQVAFGEQADAYVVDTCTVTAEADRKSRKMVHRALRLQEDAVVAVTGCAPAWDAERFSRLTGVRLVTGNEGKSGLAAAIAEALGVSPLCPAPTDGVLAVSAGVTMGTTSSTPRARAYLKVQDGCEHGCSYCIVPLVRGPERSKPIGDVVEEARGRLREGFRELVVTGVRLGSYRDGNGTARSSLASLLRELSKLDGLTRIRLSSLDPPDLCLELVQTIASLPKVCNHVHLPLQSGDSEILAAMRRGYEADEFRAAVAALRQAIPGVALTTDVMVGFPGETEAQFENTVKVCRECAFSRLHVFQYSKRPGTAAADRAEQVPEPVKRARSARLRREGQDLSDAFARQFVGRTVAVLTEQYDSETSDVEGLTEHYVRVRARASRCCPGELVAVAVESARQGALQGKEVRADHPGEQH